MSFYWQVKCETCDERGPLIRHGHTGLKFVLTDNRSEHTTDTAMLATFLELHEAHDVRLLGQG